MREETVEASREASATTFDEDVVESVEQHRRNRDAEVAFPVGLRETGTGGDRRVRVTFELPYGDESFDETFAVSPDTHGSVDDLLEVAGLDPDIDDIGQLDGRSVPVTRQRDKWRVALDEADDDRQQSRLVDGREMVASTGTVVSVLSLVGLIVTPALLVMDTIGLFTAVAAASVLVATRLLGEAVFAFGAAHDDVEAGDDFSRRWERYLNGGDPSASGFLFHLLTGGHLLYY